MTSTGVEMSLGKESLTSQASLPPPYQGDIELGALSATISSSSLQEYDTVVSDHSSSSNFHPVKSFQIESSGLSFIALPLPPRPHPIPVYAVTGSGQIAEKAYESIRPTRGSGNSLLYHMPTSSEFPVCTTTYRFGPSRPPRIRLLSPSAGTSSLDKDAPLAKGEEEFEIVGRGSTTRAVTIRTHLGTFQWRYANKAERREFGADNLIVMEQVTTVALAGGRMEERCRRIAQLVRNGEYRTAGTGRSTAGNGGRLMMDLRDWRDCKDEGRQMEAFVVASCIVILKKEKDRRRMQQAIIIAGAAGGGP